MTCSISSQLPRRCVLVLRLHRTDQDEARDKAGEGWTGTSLVFTSSVGTKLDAANVRRSFRRVLTAAELDAAVWTPRELRHSFVSLLSEHGLSVEQIADLVGHAGTTVTETVYRHQLRPVLLDGAIAMDEIFPTPGADDWDEGGRGDEAPEEPLSGSQSG